MPLFQRQEAFDPYASQRQAGAQHYNALQGEYDSFLQDPNKGMPDAQMQSMLENKIRQDVRNQFPAASKSTWRESRIGDELLKMRLNMITQRQNSMDKLRQMQTQTLGAMGGPTQPGGAAPAETIGAKASGQFAGRGAETLADSLFGGSKKAEDKKGGFNVTVNNGSQPSQQQLKPEYNT